MGWRTWSNGSSKLGRLRCGWRLPVNAVFRSSLQLDGNGRCCPQLDREARMGTGTKHPILGICGPEKKLNAKRNVTLHDMLTMA